MEKEKITKKELLELQKKIIEKVKGIKEYKPYSSFYIDDNISPVDLLKHIDYLDDKRAFIFLTMENFFLDVEELVKDLTKKERMKVIEESKRKIKDNLATRLGLYKNRITSLAIEASRELSDREKERRKEINYVFKKKVLDSISKDLDSILEDGGTLRRTRKILADNYDVSEEMLSKILTHSLKSLTPEEQKCPIKSMGSYTEAGRKVVNNRFIAIITNSNPLDKKYDTAEMWYLPDHVDYFLRSIPKMIDEYKKFEMSGEYLEHKKNKNM